MSKPITPGRAHVLAKAFELRVGRILKHSNPAVRSLHDNQPGFPQSGYEGSGSAARAGGHSDPTGDLAFAPDPARDVLDEVSALFATIDHATIRLDHLLRNWAGPSDKWRDALATEAAAKLDGWNHCQTHERAGMFEQARRENGRLCRPCEDLARDIGGDPPAWLLETQARRRLNTADIERAKRELKGKRKAKR